jgi:predicted ATPase
VRASLEWCFGDCAARDPVLAIDLAAASVPIFLELSLLNECYQWSTAALELLDDTTRGSKQELVLQEARAISSTWTLGNGDGVRAAITRAIEIADSLGETSRRLRLLVGLHIFLILVADLRGSLAVAEELDRAARSAMDASYEVISDWMLGSSHHFMGNQEAAQRHFHRGFARPSPLNVQLFGLDNRVRALVTFDRVLWLCGSADRALEIAREALAEAAKLSKPLNVCFSLLYTAPVFLWCGEFGAAREVLEKLMTHPNFHALPSLHATADALKGELLIRTGDAECGVSLLRSALLTMRADRQSLMLARATCVFAEGLTLIGQHDEALAVIGNAITDAGDGEKTAEFPEVLRVQAEILLSKPQPDESEAEDCLVRALTVARRQSALSWELRIAMTLARVQARQGRGDEARQLLSCVYSRFTEGFETGDLQAARQLLTELDEAALSHPHTTRSNRADPSVTSRRVT